MVSCHWSLLSLSGVLQFCSGYTGCHSAIKPDTYNLAVAPNVLFETDNLGHSPVWTLFSDHHGPTTIGRQSSSYSIISQICNLAGILLFRTCT